MNHKRLSLLLKCMILLTALCGLLLYLWVIPDLFRVFAAYGGNRYLLWYWPFLVAVWISAVPCYLVLGAAWSVARNIGRERLFCGENAWRLQQISQLALLDGGYWLAAMAVFALLGFRHLYLAVFSFLILCLGGAVALAFYALSRLTLRAADIQTENELFV